jgi:LytR cell envelope-related transcriptional attenuator
MEFLREIGALAGLAAFLGLAVLALLYFSQARDVRRLRENASFLVEGPEADGAEAQSAQREGVAVPAAQGREGAPPAAPPASASPREAEAFRRAELARQATERRERFERRRGGGGEGRFSSLPEPPALAVIVVGAVLLIAGVGFGATRILGGDEPQGGGKHSSAAHQLQGIIVLNSTSEPGLAAQFERQLKRQGYDAVSDNTAIPFDFSSVMYRTRAQKEAADEIAQALGIKKVGPLAAEVQPDADQAPVVVVLGQDKAQGA